MAKKKLRPALAELYKNGLRKDQADEIARILFAYHGDDLTIGKEVPDPDNPGQTVKKQIVPKTPKEKNRAVVKELTRILVNKLHEYNVKHVKRVATPNPIDAGQDDE
jgi:hypothetical protein